MFARGPIGSPQTPMLRKADFDVTILGAGPAGSTIARWLALRGHGVCLLHRAARHRSVVPQLESLSPGALHLLHLHQARACERISDRFIPCNATVLWSRNDEALSRTAQPRAVLVDRNSIDPVLRESAAEAGARYHELNAELPPPSVIHDASGCCIVQTHSSRRAIRSRFLVDATGTSSSFRGGRVSLMPRTFAVVAQVQGLRLQPSDSRVEALADGWLWAARSNQFATTIAPFLAAETIRHWGRRNHSMKVAQMLETCTLAIPKALRIVSELQVRDATAAECPPKPTEHLWRAGDAALKLDPLSGQGFQHALASAVQVAIVINTLIARPDSEAVARAFYCNTHRAAVREHLSARAALYRHQDRFDTTFWRERVQGQFPAEPARAQQSIVKCLQSKLVISRQVCWKETPIINEDFVERQEALCHPSLLWPLAYLEGQPVNTMLPASSRGCTGLALLKSWHAHAGVQPAAGIRALKFLVGHGILKRTADDPPPKPRSKTSTGAQRIHS